MLKPARNQRFSNRPTAALIAVAILGLIAVAIVASHTSGGGGFVLPAHAESNVEVKIHRDIDNLNKLIERWRGGLPEGLAKTNGRIEATEIDVSSKYAGRLERVMVDEGDEVKSGQVVARIDSPEYSAQLQTAQANVLVALDSLASAGAKIAQAQADLDYASADLERGKDLVEKGWLTKQMYDQRMDRFNTDKATVEAAAKQRDASKSLVTAAQHEAERIKSIITDLTLLSPCDCRVEYRIHRSGEVVNAGDRILQLLDLNDVYMTIYLPAGQAGKLALGDEARVILDPYPDSVIPAHISFVATEAQFTPKTVETAAEREKLIFRVKLQIEPKVLVKYHDEVKTGVRGMGFVRTDPASSWPPNLAVKLSHGD